MPRRCFPIRFEGGGGFICSSFPGEKHCVDCGAMSTRLCDFKLSNGKTCDAPMCDAHSHRVGANTDFCRLHRPKESQPGLFAPEAA